jgi:hypothetical protein
VRGKYSMGGTGVANSDETERLEINPDAMLCDPSALYPRHRAMQGHYYATPFRAEEQGRGA